MSTIGFLWIYKMSFKDQLCVTGKVALVASLHTMCMTFVSQTIWISDGCHSVHMFTAMDIENALNEADGNDSNEKLLRLPVVRVLFSSEKIQDIISLSANSVLILGQGKIYLILFYL
ncbi:hypothetical protein V8G54_011421 [Vigna mungo]|uniref:Uncharacterized protein n=1 Tax=Vigna mungo TaxID=3915 RepID=A0AAQ3NRB2_VIGMU